MEILVAILILGILLGAVLFLYLVGGRAVAHGDVRGELQRNLQIALAKMAREVESSSYEGMSSDPTTLAVLSSVPATGGPPTLAILDGSVLWQKYVVYWHDPGTKTIKQRELPFPPNPTEQKIEAWQGLTLADYRVDGEDIARNVSAFVVTAPAGTRRVEVEVTTEIVLRGVARQSRLKVSLRLKN